MSELDLTPFEINFGRPPSFDDITCGDLVLIYHEGDKKATLYIIRQRKSINLFNACAIGASFGGLWVFDRRYVSRGRNIISIYRINNLKLGVSNYE